MRESIFRFLWRLAKPQKSKFFGMFLLDSIAWPLDALLWPYIFNIAIGVFTEFDHARNLSLPALAFPISLALACVLTVETLSRSMGFLAANTLPQFYADIRMAMFDHIQHHSPRYFNEKFAGSLANKTVDMISSVEVVVQKIWFPILPAIVAITAGIIVFCFINPFFAAILLAWVVCHLTCTILFSRSINRYEYEHGEVRSTLLGKIVDSFTNNFTVNLFYRFRYEKALLQPVQEKEEMLNRKTMVRVEKMCCMLSVIFFFGNFIGIGGLAILFWVQERISTGELVQVFNTAWMLTVIAWVMSIELPHFFRSFGLMQQAYSVMQDPEDLNDPIQPRNLEVSQGEIVFRNVHFKYGTKHLFTNKNVHIRGGEKVGLVGFTGAGKSTFVNLLLRLFPIESGEILIDGQNIQNASLESLRNHIALIPQDPILFHRTLFENIQYGNPSAPEHKVLEASLLAHCDAFIRNIPGGYNAKVGERGTKLSGGEKQRIAIARAILADKPILILDEATSALDSITEKLIQDSLKTAMDKRTCLVIAHRLSTLSAMDRILVFDQGEIVEDGSHLDLLKQKKLYARMWEAQSGGFFPEIEP